MRKTTRWEGFMAVLVLVVLGMAALPALAAERPSLQGKWKLNEDLTARMRESDRPQGGPREGFGPPPGGGPGGQSGGRGPRGGGFPAGPPPGGSGGKDRQSGPGEPGGRRHPGGPPPHLAALDELTITQKNGEVTIIDKEGRTRVLKTDGKVMEEDGPRGPAEVRAHWEKDGTLVVKVKPEEGPSRTESFIVSNDGKHLYVTHLLEGDGRRPERKIRRAYDPAE